MTQRLRYLAIIFFLFLSSEARATDYTWNFSQLSDDSSTWNIQPSIYLGAVAWQSDLFVRYWDGNVTNTLNGTSEGNGWVSIWNGQAAWIGWHGNEGSDIFYWDGYISQQLTQNGFNYGFTSLYDGTIAWIEDHPNERKTEILYWNGASILNVTSGDHNEGRPSLYSDKIAWIRYDGGSDGTLRNSGYGMEACHLVSINQQKDYPAHQCGMIQSPLYKVKVWTAK